MTKKIKDQQVDPVTEARRLQERAQAILDYESLSNAFTYHTPRKDQARRYQEINDAALELGRTILREAPRSAERTLALRKLQEARMWTNASIAINERS